MKFFVIISSFLILVSSVVKFRTQIKRAQFLSAGFGSKISEGPTDRRPSAEALCACGSCVAYSNCCAPYHSQSAVPSNPVETVRSRFSAFAYSIIPYIIESTHHSHKEYFSPEQKSKRKLWSKRLVEYTDTYEFLSLAFHNEDADSAPPPGSKSAKVSFSAKLRRRGINQPVLDLIETSTFTLSNGKWLYSDGVFKNKHTRPTNMSEPLRITKETKILNIGHLPGHTYGKVEALKAAGFENSHALCMSDEGTTTETIKEELLNSPGCLFIVGGAMNSGYAELMKELNDFIATEVPSIRVHNTIGADFPPGTTYPPSEEIVNQSAVTIANRYLTE